VFCKEHLKSSAPEATEKYTKEIGKVLYGYGMDIRDEAKGRQ
jgi:hypothetical protein